MLSNSFVISLAAQFIVSGVIVFNWVLQVKYTPSAWPPSVQLLGHGLLTLQATCLLRCVLTPQLKVPEGWEAAAIAGAEPAEMCRKSDRLLPPRARYLRRRGQVILGFDHYCVRHAATYRVALALQILPYTREPARPRTRTQVWIGVPIGHSNRRYFIQYLFWSALLCIFGGSLALHEVLTRCAPRGDSSPGAAGLALIFSPHVTTCSARRPQGPSPRLAQRRRRPGGHPSS
jgi:hypothetical protein